MKNENEKGARPISPSGVLLAAAISGLLSGAAACDSESHGHGEPSGDGTARVISKSVVLDMTVERFTQDCDTRGGTVELHSHCGGVNSCHGLSYDDVTHVLSEHTCRGLNTCSGYSCVVPPPDAST
jgi:hypothetical protein